MSTLTCSVLDCPLQQGGACLEAFDDPVECPNTFEAESAQREEPEAAQSQATAEEGGAPESRALRFVTFESGESLGLSQANDLRAERPCRLILIAGEVKAGKSTLLVELFGKFLKGPYQGWSFAGSSTLKAFDRVHSPSRESSGLSLPETARTADEGMRFLHLRLSSEGRTDLMLSELSGERFKGVIEGASIKDQIPVAEAADRCLVLVDGNLMLAASTRARTFARARRLIGGLTEEGGLSPDTPTLILATKSDLWGPTVDAHVRDESEALVAFGRARGLDASWAALAARPPNGETLESGMTEVLTWMLEPDMTSAIPTVRPLHPVGRRFLQDRHE